jgi:2-succinyl-6-hydroxy-2,4-cyclohexadiene-1-carboxylate synthase
VAVERLLAMRVPGCRTTSVDLPGHGDAASDTGDLWHAADHLVARGGSGTYLGYSMGGRVALHAALTHPDEIDALVLIGTTAGIDDPTERAARRAADERLAARIEQIGVAAFVDEWLRNPLFAGLTEATAQTADRARNTPGGLASSLRGTGTGEQEPLWGRLDEITAPTLVLAGERDEKFTRLGERLAAALADATFQTIPDAGHSVHLEQPAATVDAVTRWHNALGAP